MGKSAKAADKQDWRDVGF